MKQLVLDFNNDVNQRIYSDDEDRLIDELVNEYLSMKDKVEDDVIFNSLFFEEYCIPIVRILKSESFFEGKWDLSNNQLSSLFFSFILGIKELNESTLFEFVLSLVNQLEANIRPSDWQKNSIDNFAFDRKITDGIIENVSNGNIENSILAFVGYVKIWNHYSIYKTPFNNHKATLIHRIFASKIWPKNKMSYDKLGQFQKLSHKIICKNVYIPFFDSKQEKFYSKNYLKERDQLNQNIERLFDYDFTDESEPYCNLIEDLLNKPHDSNLYIIEILRKKVNDFMYPNKHDMEMFSKLYESFYDKEFGKWLLSKFYLYSALNYDN